MRKEFQLFVIFAIFGAVILSGCTQPSQLPGDQPPVEQPPAQTATGTYYLAITDKAIKAIDTSLVSKVEVAIDNVSIHNTGTDSWVALSDQKQKFDLLSLRDINSLLSSKDLNAGTYNQLRLGISSVIVDYNSVSQEAKLPSSELKIDVQVEIDTNKVSLTVLDFDLNKSLHITGNGEIILLPVIHVVSEKDSEAEIEDGTVKIKSHGSQTQGEEIGTDLNGETGKGPKVSIGSDLEIDASGKIKEKVTEEGAGNENEAENNAMGRLVATIKDKKPLAEGSLDLNGLKELNITIDSITIHKPGSSDENASSWTELLNGEKTFNLLSLQNSEALLADLNIKVGEFTQIRLGIKEAKAVFDENSDQNGASFDVKVPSGKLKLVSKIIVDENKTSYFNIDFDLNKSLKVTGSEQITLKPVIKIVSKRSVNAKVEDGNVLVEDGTTEQDSTQEFDDNGNSTSA